MSPAPTTARPPAIVQAGASITGLFCRFRRISISQLFRILSNRTAPTRTVLDDSEDEDDPFGLAKKVTRIDSNPSKPDVYSSFQ